MAETLNSLAPLVGGSVDGDGAIEVSDVVHDHRQGGPGALFVARRGLTVDGHDFVGQAAQVCDAVCVERAVSSVSVPQLITADTGAALGLLASAVHGYPFDALRAVGVTGTNGKTMVTRLVASIVAAAGGVAAAAGTLGWTIGTQHHEQSRTSPEASDLHRIAAAMVDGGADIAAFEVSSHALFLNRVVGASFAVTAFTNLSRDHLDFHSDMESYYQVKASLFTSEHSRHGVIWTDDPAGRRLAAEAGIPVTTVGTSGDVSIGNLDPTIAGTTFSITASQGERRVALPLAGAFNVANAAVAAASALHLGVDIDSVVAGLEGAPVVSGRFERVVRDLPFAVIVDYAHTPDGIVNAVDAARRIAASRVLVVVGAGGDRDPDKRHEMGAAAAAADVVIVTNDNPRSEDPVTIAEQVMAGVSGHPAAAIELDRRAAIRRVLAEAREGDVVLILGKGHEVVQEFADHADPFNDAAVVAEEAAGL